MEPKLCRGDDISRFLANQSESAHILRGNMLRNQEPNIKLEIIVLMVSLLGAGFSVVRRNSPCGKRLLSIRIRRSFFNEDCLG